MNWDWQTATAFACIAAAAIFLIRRAVALFKRSKTAAGCGPGGCGDCPAGTQPNKAFVPLESLNVRRRP